jgi:hypothetical protein
MRAKFSKLARLPTRTPQAPTSSLPAHKSPIQRGPAALTLASLLLTALCCATTLLRTPGNAQTTPAAALTSITIHMLSGKSGKPMRDRTLRAEFRGSPIQSTILIDKRGFGTLDIPPGATAVSLMATTLKDHPTQPAYIVCGPFGQFLPLAGIETQGYAPQDACNATLQLTAPPGVVLYLIEPLPWYTPATQ